MKIDELLENYQNEVKQSQFYSDFMQKDQKLHKSASKLLQKLFSIFKIQLEKQITTCNSIADKNNLTQKISQQNDQIIVKLQKELIIFRNRCKKLELVRADQISAAKKVGDLYNPDFIYDKRTNQQFNEPVIQKDQEIQAQLYLQNVANFQQQTEEIYHISRHHSQTKENEDSKVNLISSSKLTNRNLHVNSKQSKNKNRSNMNSQQKQIENTSTFASQQIGSHFQQDDSSTVRYIQDNDLDILINQFQQNQLLQIRDKITDKLKQISYQLNIKSSTDQNKVKYNQPQNNTLQFLYDQEQEINNNNNNNNQNICAMNKHDELKTEQKQIDRSQQQTKQGIMISQRETENSLENNQMLNQINTTNNNIIKQNNIIEQQQSTPSTHLINNAKQLTKQQNNQQIQDVQSLDINQTKSSKQSLCSKNSSRQIENSNLSHQTVNQIPFQEMIINNNHQLDQKVDKSHENSMIYQNQEQQQQYMYNHQYQSNLNQNNEPEDILKPIEESQAVSTLKIKHINDQLYDLNKDELKSTLNDINTVQLTQIFKERIQVTQNLAESKKQTRSQIQSKQASTISSNSTYQEQITARAEINDFSGKTARKMVQQKKFKQPKDYISQGLCIDESIRAQYDQNTSFVEPPQVANSTQISFTVVNNQQNHEDQLYQLQQLKKIEDLEQKPDQIDQFQALDIDCGISEEDTDNSGNGKEISQNNPKTILNHSNDLVKSVDNLEQHKQHQTKTGKKQKYQEIKVQQTDKSKLLIKDSIAQLLPKYEIGKKAKVIQTIEEEKNLYAEYKNLH